MSLFTIDRSICAKDGTCAMECPLRIIDFSYESGPVPSPDAERLCVECGHCVAVCANGAFSHRSFKPADCPPFEKEKIPLPDDMLHLIRSRRSIRVFQEQPVPREVLQQLIDMARFAPTGSNSQQVKWTVLNSPQAVHAFSGTLIEAMRAAIKRNDPVAERMRLQIQVDMWDGGYDRITRGAPALVLTSAPTSYALAAVDCALALSYLDLAGLSLNLGACWAGYVMILLKQFPELLSRFDLPPDHAVLGAMMVGYPKFAYHRLPPRNPAHVRWLD
jgi:nitroreductase/NAD-dependent dihydropyrimidine dehydrogenase PreA subunit